MSYQVIFFFNVCCVFQPLTRLFAIWMFALLYSCFLLLFLLLMGCSVGMSFMSGTQPDFFCTAHFSCAKRDEGLLAPLPSLIHN